MFIWHLRIVQENMLNSVGLYVILYCWLKIVKVIGETIDSSHLLVHMLSMFSDFFCPNPVSRSPNNMLFSVGYMSKSILTGVFILNFADLKTANR